MAKDNTLFDMCENCGGMKITLPVQVKTVCYSYQHLDDIISEIVRIKDEIKNSKKKIKEIANDKSR